MINQQVKVVVANNDKRATCWCGTGKVGVATATPAIRHSPPMCMSSVITKSINLHVSSALMASFNFERKTSVGSSRRLLGDPILHFLFWMQAGVSQMVSLDTLITVSTKKIEKNLTGSTFQDFPCLQNFTIVNCCDLWANDEGKM